MTTNPVELACIDTKLSDVIAIKFENTWLASYPALVRLVHNNGGKSTGYAFAHLLHFLRIKDVPTTGKDHSLMPHANICIRQLQLC